MCVQINFSLLSDTVLSSFVFVLFFKDPYSILISLLLFEEMPFLLSSEGVEIVRLEEESQHPEVTIKFPNTKLEEREANKCH